LSTKSAIDTVNTYFAQTNTTHFIQKMFHPLTFLWVAPGCKETQLRNVTSVQTSRFTSHTTLIIESLDVAWVSALKP